MPRLPAFLSRGVARRSPSRRAAAGLRASLVGLVTTTTLFGALVVLPDFGSAPAGAAALLPLPYLTPESNMVDVAVDPAGDLWESEDNGNVNVWPATGNDTIDGQLVIPDQANTLFTLGVDAPGMVFDSSGDLFIADDAYPDNGAISVVPANNGETIFGQSFGADEPSTLVSGLDNPTGLAFDSAGNLYYATQNDVEVLPASNGTLFGQSVTLGTPAVLASGLVEGGYVAVDPGGDVFYTDMGNQEDGASSVNVLPAHTGTIFGQPVTQNTPTTLVSGLTDAAGLSLDSAGNLYVDYDNTVGVLSSSTGILDGTAVTQDVFSPIAVGLLGAMGSTFSDGSLLVVDQQLDSIDQLTTPDAAISSVTFGGSPSDPIVTVKGSEMKLGNEAPYMSTYAPGCSSTGEDYTYGNLYLDDNTGDWAGGLPGDCVGLTAAITGKRAVFGLGSFYSGNDSLNPGDSYTLGVGGTSVSGTVSYASPSSADITKVKPSNSGAGTAVTITGTDFTGTKYVFFGDVPAKATVASSTEITATVPVGSGKVSVEPVSSSGQVGTSSATYRYTAPILTGDNPAKGPAAGGTSVYLTGKGLTGATSVHFGSRAAWSFHYYSNTVVTAVSPAGTAGTTVAVTVTSPAGTSNGVN